MRALRRSLLAVVTAWTLCAFTAAPAYAGEGMHAMSHGVANAPAVVALR